MPLSIPTGWFTQAVSSAAGTLLAFAACYAIGRLVSSRRPWEAPLLGWAVVYLIAVVASLAGISALRVMLAIALGLTVISFVRQPPNLPSRNLLLYIGAGALLVLSLLNVPLYWDSYALWLPNSAYLFQYDHFPRSPLPDFHSIHPSYPAALPLIIYAASRLTNQLAELGGNVLNVLLSLCAAVGVYHLLGRSNISAKLDATQTSLRRFGLPLLAFSIVVPLNPAIELVHYWSLVADPALAIAVFIALIAWCRFMVDKRTRAGSAGSIAVRLLLLGFLIGGLKPSAWVLALILGASGAFVAQLQGVRARDGLVPAAALAGGALLSMALWKSYLAMNLPIADQFSIQPLHTWRFDLAPDLLTGILADVRAHLVYWGYVAASMAVGLVSLLKPSVIRDPLARLIAGVASVAMLLHVASLTAAYLGGGFAEWEIREAAAFQRYSSQMGYSVCIAGLLVLTMKALHARPASIKHVTPEELRIGGFASCVAIFLVFTVLPTVSMAVTKSQAHLARRQLSLDVLASIAPGSRVTVVADQWTLNLLEYVRWAALPAQRRPELVVRHPVVRAETSATARALLSRWLMDDTVDAIVLLNAQEFAFEAGLAAESDQVWRRQDRMWQVVQAGTPWPSVVRLARAGERQRR